MRVSISDGEFFRKRTAFVLNANAKRVSDLLMNRLVDLVPAGDLFYSRSMGEAEGFYRTILRRGYKDVFTGGGDGTVMNAICMMKKIAGKERFPILPRIGVLKLGTGNALASLLNARHPRADVHHVVMGGEVNQASLDLVECDDGRMAPFAGVGFDGDVLNEYVALNREMAGTIWAKPCKSVLGYMWAGVVRTLPRHLKAKEPIVRVVSRSTAYLVAHIEGQDIEQEIPAGQVLYEGPAPLVAVGSIPIIGYQLKMFPFIGRKQGLMQVRVCNANVFNLMANLYPGLWRGTYRNPRLYDFLVRDVTIESDMDLPYQVAGDASGTRKSVNFRLAQNAIQTVQLPAWRLPVSHGIKALLPAPSRML